MTTQQRAPGLEPAPTRGNGDHAAMLGEVAGGRDPSSAPMLARAGMAPAEVAEARTGWRALGERLKRHFSLDLETLVTSSETSAQDIQHRMATIIGLPMITAVGIGAVVSFGFQTKTAVLAAAGAALALALNVGLMLWGKRSDVWCTLRWLANFGIVGPALVMIGAPMTPLAVVATWTLLLIAAAIEPYGLRARIVSVAAGLVAFVAIYWSRFDGVGEFPLVVSAVAVIAAGTGAMQHIWVRTLVRLAETRGRELMAERVAHRFKMEAAIGAQTRTLIHELNNSIALIDMMSESKREDANAVIRRSVEHIKRLSALVLDGFSTRIEHRRYSVKALVEDFDLLLKKYCAGKDVTWASRVDPSASDVEFTERAGSLYFIAQNIVKNACEAMEAHPNVGTPMGPAGRITLDAARDGDMIVLGIIDNGPGIPSDVVRSILDGDGISARVGGHGIGLRFVRDECHKAGYTFDVASASGVGTIFVIKIPIIPHRPISTPEPVAARSPEYPEDAAEALAA